MSYYFAVYRPVGEGGIQDHRNLSVESAPNVGGLRCKKITFEHKTISRLAPAFTRDLDLAKTKGFRQISLALDDNLVSRKSPGEGNAEY